MVKEVDSGAGAPGSTLCDLEKPWFLHLLNGDNCLLLVMEL